MQRRPKAPCTRAPRIGNKLCDGSGATCRRRTSTHPHNPALHTRARLGDDSVYFYIINISIRNITLIIEMYFLKLLTKVQMMPLYQSKIHIHYWLRPQ